MITQAFILGAGLGTRLRPLTEFAPKPLVPIFQKPLITFAFDHLIAAGCTKLTINTHHRPEAYAAAFPAGHYRGRSLQFRHEPILLETAGGIAHVADLLGDEPFLVYNGDILSDLPLQMLMEAHERAANLVTLALRSGGGPRHIACDEPTGRVADIRNLLGTGAEARFVFSGIYAVDPEFLRWLNPGVKQSVIPVFLEMLRRGGKLGGVVIDEGEWWDVGTRDAYLQLHRDLPGLSFPAFAPDDPEWRRPVHATAKIEAGAALGGCTVVGARARIGADARLRDTIVWPGAQIASRSDLTNCIVRSAQTAQGSLRDADI